MKKYTMTWHGKKYYLLGVNTDDRKMFLEQASWDCGWYWGLGYVESFTNNRTPEKSRDIECHTHFDSLWLKDGKYNDFLNMRSPLTDAEKWQVLEIMRTLYTMRESADMFSRGGSNFVKNPIALKNQEMADKFNKDLIPGQLAELYKILEN